MTLLYGDYKVVDHDPDDEGSGVWGFDIQHRGQVVATGRGFMTRESRQEAADVAWRRVQDLPPIPAWERAMRREALRRKATRTDG